jgi:hypothetical protein
VNGENVSDPVHVQLFAVLRVAKVADVEARQDLKKAIKLGSMSRFFKMINF